MLNDTLIKHIRANGPLAIDAFMARALFDPEEGYYTTKHVFGRKGDFVTSPEICQIFGEMIAIYMASTLAAYREQDAEKPVTLVEIGPGRGTLMHDMLRTMQYMPEIARPNQVLMVEASPHLKDQQQHLLQPFLQKEPDFISWYDDLDALPKAPLMIIANEFFDALPIHQFIKKQGAWRERMIHVDGQELVWEDADLKQAGTTEETTHFLNEHDNKISGEAAEGVILEFSQKAQHIMQQLSAHIQNYGGMLLIIDYGYRAYGYGDTLQAVRNHEYANILEHIGETDITAHVNFALLKDIAEAEGLKVHTLTTQGNFLKTLGAEMRLSRLCQSAEPAQVIDLITGLERLMSPDKMGDLFKVLVVASQDVPVVQEFP